MGFTSDYAYSAPRACNEEHAPETVYDDLTLADDEVTTYYEDVGAYYTWTNGIWYTVKKLAGVTYSVGNTIISQHQVGGERGRGGGTVGNKR